VFHAFFPVQSLKLPPPEWNDGALVDSGNSVPLASFPAFGTHQTVLDRRMNTWARLTQGEPPHRLS